MRLADKVIVVTGGRAGIGAAIVQRLTADGARVVWTDIEPNPDQQAPQGATFFRQDVGSPEAWLALEQFLLETYGAIDGLVNNAGIYRHESIVETSVPSLREFMRVHAEGGMLGCQMALRLMRRGGAIVNISSAAATRPGPASIPYGMSKAAVLNLTQAVASHCIANKLAIRCNSICPGGVDTPMSVKALAGADAAQLAERLVQTSIVGRLGKPEEIANAVSFLISDEAAFLTGEAMLIDGGISL